MVVASMDLLSILDSLRGWSQSVIPAYPTSTAQRPTIPSLCLWVEDRELRDCPTQPYELVGRVRARARAMLKSGQRGEGDYSGFLDL